MLVCKSVSAHRQRKDKQHPQLLPIHLPSGANKQARLKYNALRDDICAQRTCAAVVMMLLCDWELLFRLYDTVKICCF